jgi:hypothetical protein
MQVIKGRRNEEKGATLSGFEHRNGGSGTGLISPLRRTVSPISDRQSHWEHRKCIRVPHYVYAISAVLLMLMHRLPASVSLTLFWIIKLKTCWTGVARKRGWRSTTKKKTRPSIDLLRIRNAPPWSSRSQSTVLSRHRHRFDSPKVLAYT